MGVVATAGCVWGCDPDPDPAPTTGADTDATTGAMSTAADTGGPNSTGTADPDDDTGNVDEAGTDTGVDSGADTAAEVDTGSGDPACDGVPGDMVCVPAGDFPMGSKANSDELPLRTVSMPTYFIDITEVTVAQYAECVAAGNCPAEEGLNEYPECNWQVAGREDHPVNCLQWVEAEAYCAWAGKRLPTEAEWEKAAVGPEGFDYPWAGRNVTCNEAVMFDDSGAGCGTDGTWAVGSKSPAGDSPYGAMDMAGNVYEWTSSAGTGGTSRQIRGGSYSSPEDWVTVDRRNFSDTPNRYDNNGVRCVSDL